MASYKLDPNARYAKSHEWVRVEDGVAVVGITDAAQDMLSDVVYVELPAVGDSAEAGAKVADVESVKAAEEVIAPVSGKVVAVNQELEKTPELINTAPYSAWFVKIEPTRSLEAELANLMTPEAYEQFLQENAH
jgi:glycine cleavage system H protein